MNFHRIPPSYLNQSSYVQQSKGLLHVILSAAQMFTGGSANLGFEAVTCSGQQGLKVRIPLSYSRFSPLSQGTPVSPSPPLRLPCLPLRVPPTPEASSHLLVVSCPVCPRATGREMLTCLSNHHHLCSSVADRLLLFSGLNPAQRAVEAAARHAG